MSWASRRRTTYATGVTLFFLIVIGGPAAWWYFSIPPTCDDSIKNQGETAIDKGGPCPILDERMLQPISTLWVRSFRVRDGSYNAVAYIQNPNENAGIRAARYRIGLYDKDNILVAERMGTTFIMPGGITPVFEGAIDAGNRVAVHTYVNFDPASVVWDRLRDPTKAIRVTTTVPTDVGTEPRLTAEVKNTDVSDMQDVAFTAVIFDPAGNAFTASQTLLSRLNAGESQVIVFTWPDPFGIQVGRVDIIPVMKPVPVRPTQ